MAALRAHQFYSGNVTGAGPFTLYTVPAGHEISVRTLTVQNMTSGTPVVEFFIATVADLWVVPLTTANTAGAFQQLTSWIHLTPGQVLKFLGAAGFTFGVTVSGYYYFI